LPSAAASPEFLLTDAAAQRRRLRVCPGVPATPGKTSSVSRNGVCRPLPNARCSITIPTSAQLRRIAAAIGGWRDNQKWGPAQSPEVSDSAGKSDGWVGKSRGGRRGRGMVAGLTSTRGVVTGRHKFDSGSASAAECARSWSAWTRTEPPTAQQNPSNRQEPRLAPAQTAVCFPSAVRIVPARTTTGAGS